MNKKMKKDISSHKKALRERVKSLDTDFKATLSLDNDLLTIKNFYDEYIFQIEPVHGMMFINRFSKNSRWYDRFPKKPLAEIGLNYWDEFAKITDMGAVFIKGTHVNETEKTEREEFFEKHGFKAIKEFFNDEELKLVTKYLLKKENQENGFVKELKADYIKKVLNMIQIYEKEIVKTKEKNPTFECRNLNSSLTNISFYLLGYHGKITSHMDDGKFILKEKTYGEVAFEKFEDIGTSFEKIIKEILDDNRMKALFEQPTYHFERVSRNLSINKELKNKILNQLKVKYTPKKLEESLAIQYDKKEIIRLERNYGLDQYIMFQILDVVFVCRTNRRDNKKDHLESFDKEDFNQAQERLKEIMFNDIDSDINEATKLIKDK